MVGHHCNHMATILLFILILARFNTQAVKCEGVVVMWAWWHDNHNTIPSHSGGIT